MELPKDVQLKLSEAVILWADTNLIGKPALLANILYMAIEQAFIKKIEEINETFGYKKDDSN